MDCLLLLYVESTAIQWSNDRGKAVPGQCGISEIPAAEITLAFFFPQATWP